MRNMQPKQNSRRVNTRSRCAPNEEGRKHYLHEHKEIEHELYFMKQEIKNMMANGFEHEKTELVDTCYHVMFRNPATGDKKEIKIQFQENFNHLEPMFMKEMRKH